MRRDGDEGALTGAEDLARHRVDDVSGGPGGSAALLDDPTFSPDRASRVDRASEGDVHAGRDAPGAATDDGPRHDLVEERADDPAVRHGLPALKPRLERQLGPGSFG